MQQLQQAYKDLIKLLEEHLKNFVGIHTRPKNRHLIYDEVNELRSQIVELEAKEEPNLSAGEVEKLAEDFKNNPYYENGQSLSVAPKIYLKRGFIAGFKAASQFKDKPLLQWVEEKIKDCTDSLKEYQYSEYLGNRNYDLISMKKATLVEVKQKIESL